MPDRVLGVDACKTGWVGIALHGEKVTAYAASSIMELVSLADADGEVAVIAIDIPIGLADSGPRAADILAARLVGARRSSVFQTPVRPALEAEDHASAAVISRRLTGAGISIQAFSLKPKIFEVDAWVRGTDRRVVEVHPELSFAQMAGDPLPDSKVTWAGAEHRRALLAAAGIPLTADIGTPGRVARVDDVLDAGAAAWTARRVAGGDAVCVPNPPEEFSDGLSCAIWT